jgi:hypothetical protein
MSEKFSVRFLKEGDYEAMLPWFKWWRFPAPPKDMLPENGLGGVMVKTSDIDVCAGFLYFTNSKTVWIEFVVSNPEYREKDRVEAVRELLIQLKTIAKGKGMKYAFMSVKNEWLIKHLESVGFIAGSKNTSEMFAVL